MIRRDELIGPWELQSYRIDRADGTVGFPLGEDPVGIIIFTADGYMSAQLMRRDRPHYERASMTGGTDSQLADAARGYLAYAGRWDFDDRSATSVHHVSVSLLPNWLGEDQFRHAKVNADTLTLSASRARDVGEETATLVWARPGRSPSPPNA